MGQDPDRELPFFFTKFAEAIVPSGSTIPYPPMTENFHYEGELVIAIGKEGFSRRVEDALSLVFGYATGLDMTRRDLQFAARDKGRPWDMGKSFAHSAPISSIHRAEDIGHPTGGSIRLTVNGEVKQDADLSELIWSCAEIVSILSFFESLYPGDLIFTGTPAGVGPVSPGDRIRVEISQLTPLEVGIGAPGAA